MNGGSYAKLVDDASVNEGHERTEEAMAKSSSEIHGSAFEAFTECLQPTVNPVKREVSATLNKNSLLIDTELLTVDGLPKLINEEDWTKYATHSGLFFPVAPIKFKWDLFMLVLILYSSVTVPFRLCMDHPATDAWWILEVFVSLCFIMDLFLTFNTAYLDGDQFVLDRPMIRINYLRTWLLLDLTSSIPLELIDAIVQTFGNSSDGVHGSGLRMLRALRLVRLLRLLRLLKIQKYMNLIEDALNINLAFLQLAKLICGLAYLMHVLGCGWFWLANVASDDEETWLDHYNSGAGVDADVWTQYLFSIYWALTTLTTVGYGDIVPMNDTERLYTLFGFLLGALVFGYLLSNVSEMVKNADPNAVKIEEKLDEIKVYLRWHKFKPELAARVRRYYEFYFSRRSAMDEEGIVKNLAPTLKRSVQAHLVHRTVERLPLFSSQCGYISLDVQLQIYEMLRPILREAKEAITFELEKGAVGQREVFFVRRGTITACGDLEDLVFYELDASMRDAGCIIGEHALMRGAQCHSSYRGKTRVELFAMAVEDLFQISATLRAEDRDQLADTVYETYTNRQVYRALAMRRAFNAALATSVGSNKAMVAALRLQTYWARRRATLCCKTLEEKSMKMSELLPGLYDKTFLDTTSSSLSMEQRIEQLQAGLVALKEQFAALPTRKELEDVIKAMPTRNELSVALSTLPTRADLADMITQAVQAASMTTGSSR